MTDESGVRGAMVSGAMVVVGSEDVMVFGLLVAVICSVVDQAGGWHSVCPAVMKRLNLLHLFEISVTLLT